MAATTKTKGGGSAKKGAAPAATRSPRREKNPAKNGVVATLKPLEVPVAGLTPYPRNPRNGDTDAIRESLLAHGQYRPIVVRKSTGEVLAGNHTYAAALELGWDHVAATYVDVDGGHSTQKPVELMAIPIRNHTGGVYDPFAGSGTTLVAAEDLHRPSWHMEIDPAYCDVIVDRWEAHTGQRAVRP